MDVEVPSSHVISGLIKISFILLFFPTGLSIVLCLSSTGIFFPQPQDLFNPLTSALKNDLKYLLMQGKKQVLMIILKDFNALSPLCRSRSSGMFLSHIASQLKDDFIYFPVFCWVGDRCF